MLVSGCPLQGIECFTRSAELGGLYMFACSIYVAFEMNETSESYKTRSPQLIGAFGINDVKRKTLCLYVGVQWGDRA